MKADGLGSAVSNQSGPSNFLSPFLQRPRACSTVSLAQGSGRSSTGARRQDAPGLCLRSGGAILTVTGLQVPGGRRALGCHRSVALSLGPQAFGTTTVSRGGWAGRRLHASATTLRGGAPVPRRLGRGPGGAHPAPWAGRAGAAGSGVLRYLPMGASGGEVAPGRDSASRSPPGRRTGRKRSAQVSGDRWHLDVRKARGQGHANAHIPARRRV